jgi:hypothetical protein
MPQENLPPNRLFKLVIVISAAFVLTILLMIVTALSSIESPLVKFFNAHGLKLIGAEVVLILVSAVAAMWIDSRQTSSAAGYDDPAHGDNGPRAESPEESPEGALPNQSHRTE